MARNHDSCAAVPYHRLASQGYRAQWILHDETHPQGRSSRRRSRHPLPPATKAIPKEMLTIVDRPVVQHVVDEARAAGIEHFIFVTGRNKGVIEDHFDMAYELDDTLAKRNKVKELEALKHDLPAAGATSFTRQQAPLGLGHAVWCARDSWRRALRAAAAGHAALQPGKGCLAEMIEAYDQHGGNHIAVAPVPDDQTHQYGIVGVQDAAKVSKITGMVEKPPKGTAPSNLHISGRYILQPTIFNLLANQEKGAGGEIQLTDSMIACRVWSRSTRCASTARSTMPARRSASCGERRLCTRPRPIWPAAARRDREAARPLRSRPVNSALVLRSHSE
jgi:UTP--glucose-1-phosphate uridylyltransferase